MMPRPPADAAPASASVGDSPPLAGSPRPVTHASEDSPRRDTADVGAKSEGPQTPHGSDIASAQVSSPSHKAAIVMAQSSAGTPSAGANASGNDVLSDEQPYQWNYTAEAGRVEPTLIWADYDTGNALCLTCVDCVLDVFWLKSVQAQR